MSHIISLDVGSTTIRSVVYDGQAQVVARADQQTATIGEGSERCEVDEEGVLKQVVSVIKQSLSEGNLQVSDIACMGISTQRNTFITWNSDTGEVYHPLVSWKDSRSSVVAKRLNQSLMMRVMRGVARMGYWLTGSGRLLTASTFKFNVASAAIKLKWMIGVNEKLRKHLKDPKAKKHVKFGTLDTWLLWKLTNGQVYATDFSMASSTSLFDPYTMSWSSSICFLLSIPTHILPPIHETSSNHCFHSTHPSFFGTSIPITALVADQQASVFGQCCFEQGDVKCTLGTGTFVDCNTGEHPYPGGYAHYPLVGWKYRGECRFLVESYSSNTASTVLWCCVAGLSKNVQELSSIAFSALPPSLSLSSSPPLSSSLSPLPSSSPSPPSSSCLEDAYLTKPLCFVGSFNGLQVPKHDYNSGPLLIGLTEKTTSNQIVRSALNFIVFLFYWMTTELKKSFKNFKWDEIKCDGGVSNNDYILTSASHLLQCDIYRPSNTDSTSLGCAYLAGLAKGIWKDKEEIKNLNNINNKNDVNINYENNKKNIKNQNNDSTADNKNNIINNENITHNENIKFNGCVEDNIQTNKKKKINNNNNNNNNSNRNRSRVFTATSPILTHQLQHEYKHFMQAVHRGLHWYQ